jgi:hypothetical protein
MSTATATTSLSPEVAQQFADILQDPVFTPEFKAQLSSVQEFQRRTEQFADSVINGNHTHAVLQGPPGLGKSYAVTQALKRAGKVEGKDYFVVKGHITPMQLYLVLHHYRRPGQIVILDDCDDVLTKDTGLEVLKAACDQDYRRVVWASANVPIVNGHRLDEFIFNGQIVVCTNMSIATGRGGRRDRAAAAFLSRLTYWNLQLDSRERMFAQIFNMVVVSGYLDRSPRTTLTIEQKQAMLKFILLNLDEIVCLDLRMPQHIASEINAHPDNWEISARHIITHGVV